MSSILHELSQLFILYCCTNSEILMRMLLRMRLNVLTKFLMEFVGISQKYPATLRKVSAKNRQPSVFVNGNTAAQDYPPFPSTLRRRLPSSARSSKHPCLRILEGAVPYTSSAGAHPTTTGDRAKTKVSVRAARVRILAHEPW